MTDEWKRLDTHVLLWILIAFAIGTSWTPIVELIEPVFTIDNASREPNSD